MSSAGEMGAAGTTTRGASAAACPDACARGRPIWLNPCGASGSALGPRLEQSLTPAQPRMQAIRSPRRSSPAILTGMPTSLIQRGSPATPETGPSREAHLSAEPTRAQASPWLSPAHVHQERSQDRRAAPRPGPQAPVGLIGIDQFGDGGRADAAPPLLLHRLTKRWQFLACAKGRSLARGAVAIQRLAREDGRASIGVGFTATKKLGGAVVRNRAKRRMREAARLLLPLHGSPSYDYVFVARSGAPEREWLRLLDDVKTALLGLAAGGGDARPPRTRPSRTPPGSTSARPKPAASAPTRPGPPSPQP